MSNGKNCREAIDELAEQTGTEWWMEGYTLNLSRCEHGDYMPLGYGQGLTSLSKGRNEKTPFFTRLYPVGGTRNIDRERYGAQRLQLPDGLRYIEKNTHYGIFERSEEEAFSHIYPHRVGFVGQVRSETRTIDGQEVTIWFFKDPDLNFDPNTYQIAGLVKHIVFQGGPLNGYDFEANYHSNTGEFELITQHPYENMQLPGGSMVPEPGDAYILWNIRMPEEYERAAEQELLKVAEEFLALGAIDTSVYKGKTHYIDLDERGVHLVKGRRVLLISDIYFDEGSRASRITSITRKISSQNEADIECAYAVTPGRIATIESQVGQLRAAFAEKLDEDHLQILKSWDSADPTEYNVFSAKRALKESLSRLHDDQAQGFISFLRGLGSGEFISGFLDGKGWRIHEVDEINPAGATERKSVAEFDDVVVRRGLRVFELVINQTKSEGGNIVFADGMRVERVDVEAGRIWLDTAGGVLWNPFRPDDCLLCQRFGGKPSEDNDWNVVKEYECVVAAAEWGSEELGEERLDWIDFRNFKGDISQVAKGDVLVRVDNLSDVQRKGIIMMVTNGADAPYIDVVYGLKTDPEGAVKSRSGNLSGIVHPLFGPLEGFGQYVQNIYAIGRFMFKSGRSVETAIEMLEGLFRSSMQKQMYALTEGDNYLHNATFTEQMEGWECENGVSPITVGGQLLTTNRALATTKEQVAAVVEHNGRNVLRLKDSYVRQANALIRQPEVVEQQVIAIDEATGEEVVETQTRRPILYLSFRMTCRSAGTLTVGFEGAGQPAEGEQVAEDQQPLPLIVKQVAAGDPTEPQTFSWQGTWDGQGDFLLAFTGDAYFEEVSVTSRPLEDYKAEVSTLFEQTSERILLQGKRLDLVDQSLGTVSIELDAVDTRLSLTAERVNRLDLDVAGLSGDVQRLWSQIDLIPGQISLEVGKELADGSRLISAINMAPGEITIDAAKIRLEGYTTINGAFSVDLQGNMTAKGATLEDCQFLSADGTVGVAVDNEGLIIMGFSAPGAPVRPNSTAHLLPYGISLRSDRVAFNVNLYVGGLGVSLIGLPTSDDGLSSGGVWRDGTTLKIVS